MSLKHPTERGETGRRGFFDRLAQRASYFSSSPLFFLLCVALVLAWVAGYVFGAGDAYEQAIGTALTAVTLLLVALLKERRAPLGGRDPAQARRTCHGHARGDPQRGPAG